MGSRNQKIGSIYSKMTNLLLKKGETNITKPLWYDIYTHFPPDKEPVFNRKVEDVPVKQIFYPEDIERAKVHKAFGRQIAPIDLTKNYKKSQTQEWIELYKQFIEQGDSENEALEKVVNAHNSKMKQLKVEQIFKKVTT